MDERDVSDAQAALADTFGTGGDGVVGGVAVADGFGLRVAVDRGELVVADGIGRHRRQRRFARASRDLRRLVVLGANGSVSLDALRWCADVGCAVVVIDGSRPTFASTLVHTDARLHRALAWAPWEPVGLDIARYLIASKLAGQAAVVARPALGGGSCGTAIGALAATLDGATTIAEVRLIEAQAAAAYFSAWSTVTVTFATAERQRARPHWLRPFPGRRSPLSSGGGANSKAVHPITAMMNYLGALAEAEAVIAATTVGLAPDLGIIHADTGGRASLALDLMEPVRPVVEGWLVDLVAQRSFRARDFTEAPDGVCRLLAPFTHELAAVMPAAAAAVAPVAEKVVAMLGAAGDRPIATRTPLTGTNRRPETARSRALRLPFDAPTCRRCGARLRSTRATYCAECWPLVRSELAAAASAKAAVTAAERTAAGEAHPGHNAASSAKRSVSITAAWAARLDVAARADGGGWTIESYANVIFPALGAIELAAIMTATGMSRSSASSIRSGRRRPHPRHWPALAALVGMVPGPERIADGFTGQP